jgi:capsular exopolysaccharide synthesis family protein
VSRVDDAARRSGHRAVAGAIDEGSATEPPDASALAEQLFTAEPPDADELARQFYDAEPAAPPPPPVPPNALVRASPSGDARTPAAATAAAPPRVRTEAPSALDGVTEPAPAESLFDRMSTDVAQKVVIDKGLQASSREQYRRLAATLHHGQMMHGLKVVTLTSALPGEGKTLTSANLAMTLSESYRRRVLLIDADLRRPSLHTVFKIDNSSGLCEGLAAVDERPMPIRQVSPHLSILPAGQPNSDPMAGLISDRFRRLILEARETFDWVIIDTPPVALLTDSRLLASESDGVILVVRAESTSYEIVKRASESLGRERILGVVLNSALIGARGSTYTYYGSYGGGYYYGPRPRQSSPSLAARIASKLPRFGRAARHAAPAAPPSAAPIEPPPASPPGDGDQ